MHACACMLHMHIMHVHACMHMHIMQDYYSVNSDHTNYELVHAVP